MTVLLAEEHRMLQDLVARFVDEQLIPLEPKIIERDIKGERAKLTDEEEAPLLAKCKELGLWALDVPEEHGGANLPAVALMAVNEELWRTIVPFTLPPDSPNLHMLMAVASPEQKKKSTWSHMPAARLGARSPSPSPEQERIPRPCPQRRRWLVTSGRLMAARSGSLEYRKPISSS